MAVTEIEAIATHRPTTTMLEDSNRSTAHATVAIREFALESRSQLICGQIRPAKMVFRTMPTAADRCDGFQLAIVHKTAIPAIPRTTRAPVLRDEPEPSPKGKESSTEAVSNVAGVEIDESCPRSPKIDETYA